MAAYVVMLVILAAWAFFALRDGASVRICVIIYGVNLLVGNAAEFLFAILLDRYTFTSFTNFLLVTAGIEPLLGLLYAHYSRRLPVMRAVGAAVVLGGPLERLYMWLGVYRYDRGWHPLLTMICFTGYFLWTWWLVGFLRRRYGAAPWRHAG